MPYIWSTSSAHAVLIEPVSALTLVLEANGSLPMSSLIVHLRWRPPDRPIYLALPHFWRPFSWDCLWVAPSSGSICRHGNTRASQRPTFWPSHLDCPWHETHNFGAHVARSSSSCNTFSISQMQWAVFTSLLPACRGCGTDFFPLRSCTYLLSFCGWRRSGYWSIHRPSAFLLDSDSSGVDASTRHWLDHHRTHSNPQCSLRRWSSST